MNKIWEIRARCTPAEHAALVTMAQSERRKLSELLRECVRETAKRRGLWPPAEAAQTGREVTAR